VIGSLLLGGLAGSLIASLGSAIRRSTHRLESARLRDQLVDAARTGELDLADWRVFSLIDWLDQVATTGRTSPPGRHARERPAGIDTLAGSLAVTLAPQGHLPAALPGPGAELRATALAYRERHQRRHQVRLPRPRAAGSRARMRVAVPIRRSLAEEIFAVAGPAR
jgi:hypothetical protein